MNVRIVSVWQLSSNEEIVFDHSPEFSLYEKKYI